MKQIGKWSLNLTRLCNFSGETQTPVRIVPQVIRKNITTQVETNLVEEETLYQGQDPRPQQNQGIELGIAGCQPMVLVG